MSTAPARRLTVTDAEQTRALGARLAALLRPGDLVMLSGELGAGKTTLAQGVGAAMKVRGRVSSPTFIIARTHRATGDGPDLIHVDAYRLGSLEEIDALDLESSMDSSVTLVEWGRGKVESLAADRLEIEVSRPRGALAAPTVIAPKADTAKDAATAQDAPAAADTDLAGIDDGHRVITIRALGARWAGVDLGVVRP